MMKKLFFGLMVCAMVFGAACEGESGYKGPGRGSELLRPPGSQAGTSQYELALAEYEAAKDSIRISSNGGLSDQNGNTLYIGMEYFLRSDVDALNNAVTDLQADIAWLVNAGVALSSFDNYAVLIRQEVAGFLSKIQVGEQPVGLADLAGAIKKAEIALGDLSTVGANITLPEMDPAVTVTWVSSNTSVLSNTGVVTRPSGTPAELTLTGTFTAVADPEQVQTRVWNVRVMHTGAAPAEFLNVHYVVQDGEWKNIAWSGDYYTPSLEGGASVGTGTGAASSYGYVNVGSNGYIDLGPKVGALLRKPEWTVEFIVRLAADSGTMLSFANDENINTTTADSWRGTVLFHNPGLYLKAMNHGYPGVTSGTEGSGTDAAITGNSMGISASRLGQWVSLGLIKNSGSSGVNIMRNYGRAQSQPGTNMGRIVDSNDFGSGSEELEDLRYAYLGRSVLANSGGSGNPVDGTPGAWYLEIKVYSRSVSLVNTTEHPNMTSLRAAKKVINDAFGFSDTN